MGNDAGLEAGSGAAEVAKDVTLMLNLAVRRTRGNVFAPEEVKDLVCGVLEEGKRKMLLIQEHTDRVDPKVVEGGQGVARARAGGTPGWALSGPAGKAGEGTSSAVQTIIGDRLERRALAEGGRERGVSPAPTRSPSSTVARIRTAARIWLWGARSGRHAGRRVGRQGDLEPQGAVGMAILRPPR